DREIGTVLRLLGLPMLASTAIFGLPGLVMALTGLLIHVASLRSYGMPYLDPYPLFRLRDRQDTVRKRRSASSESGPSTRAEPARRAHRRSRGIGPRIGPGTGRPDTPAPAKEG